MKYIKRFENLTENLTDVKEYFVIPSGPDLLFVFQNIGVDIMLEAIHIYTYNKNNEEIIKIDDSGFSPYRFSYSNLNNFMLYESDDLQSVLDKLPMLVNIKKYNL